MQSLLLAVTRASGIRVCVCFGGVGTTAEQVRDLAERPHIVIGSPARIEDAVLHRQRLSLTAVRAVCVLECDHVAEAHGEQVHTLLAGAAAPGVQLTLLSSASGMVGRMHAFMHPLRDFWRTIHAPTLTEPRQRVIVAQTDGVGRVGAVSEAMRVHEVTAVVVLVPLRMDVAPTAAMFEGLGHHAVAFEGDGGAEAAQRVARLLRARAVDVVVTTPATAIAHACLRGAAAAVIHLRPPPSAEQFLRARALTPETGVVAVCVLPQERHQATRLFGHHELAEWHWRPVPPSESVAPWTLTYTHAPASDGGKEGAAAIKLLMCCASAACEDAARCPHCRRAEWEALTATSRV
jgi:hypothetical protein